MVKNIKTIAKKLNLTSKDLILYGDHIAKVNFDQKYYSKDYAKLILVTAMTSNSTGIGKTTISIGLADALTRLNKNACLALREPSLGPVFGIKGGATGGGKASIYPENEINLHFTGDFAAIEAANNLLCAIVDNHIFQGNSLNIDPSSIFVKRCIDVNDRSLRNFSYSIRDSKISSEFEITAASEMMAIVCLSESIDDLKCNIGNILVALNKNKEPVYARDLKAEEALTILLKNALKPNLVQTLEGTPAFVHLGPFANIAHGCNSISATKYALTHSDFCVTEAGFGSDLGAEKFIDIKTRLICKTPDVAVLVVVADVIKEHGGGSLEKGLENIGKHIQNLKDEFKANVVVAINRHTTDSDADITVIKNYCQAFKVDAIECNAFTKGSEGCLELAKAVVDKSNIKSKINYTYEINDPLEVKIEKIAKKIYGASDVVYSDVAKDKLNLAKSLGFDNYFVNIAKTQFSFSDNKALLGAPKDFTFNITDINIRSGAKMIVAIAGNMMLMPGLGKKSNYLHMHISSDGKIDGVL